MNSYHDYEVSINEEKQNFHRKAWKHWVAHESDIQMCAPLSDEILDGWERSRNYGIDPYQKSVERVLSPAELELLRRKNYFFLNTSRPVLENLINFVKDSGFNVAISDNQGILMDVFGDEVSTVSSKRGNWAPGADWSESSIGNNVVGTSIYLNKPMMVIGYEHYCRCCHHWAAAAAPIYDSNHSLAGTIALCGRFEKIHAHTLGMVIAAAQAIQMQLEVNCLLKQLKLSNKYQRTVINSVADGIIGIETEGIITFCNKKCFEILRLSEEDLIGINIFSLLEPQMIQWFKNPLKESEEQEVIFHAKNRFIKCICSFQLINKGNCESGMVIVLRDFDSVVKMANQFVKMNPFWKFDSIIGTSPKFLNILHVAKIAAQTDSSVLLLGESGTGKDVLAQAIHNESPRRNRHFVAVNCGAIPRDLIASELFGYSEGAFTGAKKGGNKGKFEVANGGTIFLDEIGEMPLEQQIVLLRVLEESSFTPVGSSVRIPLDVRIICATNKDIYREVENNRFRQDLFYRLNVFTINTVPLRDRKEDIEELSNEFLKKMAAKTGRDFVPLNSGVLEILISYDWPGNIRELQNSLERAYMVSNDGAITPDILSIYETVSGTSMIPRASAPGTYMETAGEGERKPPTIQSQMASHVVSLLIEQLKSNNYNVTKTCEMLNISRTTLYRHLKKNNIKIPR